ncbi:MAG: tripartite tricarboxylate transporter permease [Actinobacteria bacterium]|nr:tripartite tricarboxylate transporter permease [Actinomycetota bacterium]
MRSRPGVAPPAAASLALVMLSQLLAGLRESIGGGSEIAWLAVGTLLGLVVGVIPGLSGAVILSVVLVFVYHLSLQATLVFFLATHAAGFFSASLTSIFLNTPAHPEAVPVAFDGYPMAVKGQAARALGVSAASTAIGALLGFVALVAIFPYANRVSLLFHPPEYVALILLAMVLVGTLSVKRLSKGLISVCVGLLISTIGVSGITGASRFTFNQPYLLNGIPLAVLSIGLFALPQMMMVYGTATNAAKQDITGNEVAQGAPVKLGPRPYRQVAAGLADAVRQWRILLQSTVLGVGSGIVPGIGGFAANYLSYTTASQLSRRKRGLFGTGIPEGVAAAEASNIPKEQGGLLTVFGLGLPHGTSSALFLVALTIQGLRPGIGFPAEHPEIIYESLWIILLAGFLGTLGGVVAAPAIARGTKIPGPLLFPFVISMCAVGAFIGYRSYSALIEALACAILGLAMRRLGYSLAAVIIGVVMGGVLEQNIYLVHNLYPGTKVFTSRPGADVIFGLAIIVLIVATIRTSRLRAKNTGPQFPVLETVTNAVIVVAAGSMAYYAATHYTFVTAVMPVLVGSMAGATACYQLVNDGLAELGRRRRSAAPEAALAMAGPGGSGVPAAYGASAEVVAVSGPPLAADNTGRAADERVPHEHAVPDSAAQDGHPAVSPPDAVGVTPLVRDRSWGRDGQYRREAMAFGWIVVAILLFYLVGFHLGVPLFALAYGLVAVRRVLQTAMARCYFAVASAIVLFLGTSLLFHVVVVVETPRIGWFANFSFF